MQPVIQTDVACHRKIVDTAVDVAKKRNEGLKSVQLPEDLNKDLDDYCARKIKVKRSTIIRILERFLAAPDSVKTVVFLGEEDRDMEGAYAAALEDVARQLRQRRAKRPEKEIVSQRAG